MHEVESIESFLPRAEYHCLDKAACPKSFPCLQEDLSPAALLAAAKVLKQECLALSSDYMRNPTLVKTLAASIVNCLQGASSRQPDEILIKATEAALEAAQTLLSRARGEEGKIAQAGLVSQGLDILQKIDSGKSCTC